MKWTELLAAVGERSGASADETRAVLEALVDVSIEALVQGDKVVVPGFVNVIAQWQPPRTVRSVRDRRRLALDGRFVPRLRAGSRLKAALAESTPQRWRDPEHQKAWRMADALLGDLELYHSDRIPTLTADSDLELVEERCAAAFGAAWDQVRETYRARVPEQVRGETRHLTLTARRRWASR